MVERKDPVRGKEDKQRELVTENVWRDLRCYTDARIGLGRAGISLPTRELLAFQLAHAQARDAVHFPLHVTELMAELDRLGTPGIPNPAAVLHSCAQDRFTYLQRPDLGRCLCQESRALLQQTNDDESEGYDLALVVVDGLSSAAIQQNAAPFLNGLLNDLVADQRDWSLAPLAIVQQGRVAIGDEVGALLKAKAVVVLIGERPGLSSPDSLGVYLTWGPKSGLSDAKRNCISNIRPAGLKFEDASQRLLYLLRQASRLQLSGVGLKDRTEEVVIETLQTNKNFLTN